MRGYFAPFFLFLFLLAMFGGQAIYNEKVKTGEQASFNITNYTDSTFSLTTGILEEETEMPRLNNVIYKLYDLVYELVRLSTEFGYENPQYDFMFVMLTLLVVMMLPMVIPLVALVYVIGVGLKDLISRLRKKG